MQSTFHLLLTLDKPSEQHFQVLFKVRLTKSCCWNPALFSLPPSIHSVYIFQMGFYKIMCKQSGKNRTKTGHCISFSVQSVRELTEATGGAERESCPVEHTPAAGGQWSPRKMIGKTVLFFLFFWSGWGCIPVQLRKHNSQLGLPPCFHSDHSHAILYLLTRQPDILPLIFTFHCIYDCLCFLEPTLLMFPLISWHISLQ